MRLDDGPRCYRAFGLRIHSNYPLPAPVIDRCEPRGDDVSLTVGATDEQAADTGAGRRRTWTRDARGGVLRFENDNGYLLQVSIDAIGTRMDVAFNRLNEDISGVLFGAAMGALLRMRGTAALHATTLADGIRGVALAGRPGAGKTSLAAMLNRIGLAFVSDDLTPFRIDGDRVLVQPGGPLRLCPDVAARASALFDVQPDAEGTDGKRPIPASHGGARDVEARLDLIYILEGRSSSLDRPRIAPLPRAQACAALTAFIYGSEWLSLDVASNLEVCGQISSRVDVRQLWMPDDIAAVDAAATALRADLAT